MTNETERLRGRMAMNESFRRYYRNRLRQAEQSIENAFYALLNEDSEKALVELMRFYGANEKDLAEIIESRTSDF